MEILIVQSFKVNDNGIFGLLEFKFRNEMVATNNDEPNYEYAPPVDILRQTQSGLGLGLLGHGQALPEVVLHEDQAVAQDDLGLPPKNFLGLCDVWLPLARIIRGVLGHRHCHFWVDQLQS